jgi:putative transposase
VENAFIESFNGRFRDECLNEHWFPDLHVAREKIEVQRRDYNSTRPHSSWGNLTPEQFIRQYQTKANTPEQLSPQLDQ